MKRSIYIIEICLVLYLLPFSGTSQDLIEQGKNLFQSERYDEAKIIFEEVLNLNSENTEANYFMGRIHFAAGEYNKATEYSEKAVKIDEENIDYHLWLATVYQEKARRANFLSAAKLAGKWRKELERAFEIDSKNIGARRRLIFYYLNAPGIGGGDEEKGKKLAEETIKIDEIQGRLLLAYAFQRKENVEAAIAEYQKVVQLDPQNRSAYNSLGYIILKQKDYDAAEFNFKKYIEVAPADPNAYDSMGDYYSERGRARPSPTSSQSSDLTA
jgi:tetratricopeptide (TPR) repeat protein